ncbi:MAG: hypothetical protein H6725_01965 [Sandaracinaceae bacterium]|nr:hypothetical protein [Sandaracinaceae bacterium]
MSQAPTQRARVGAALPLLLGALCLAQLVLVAAGLPLVRTIPAWFYAPRPRGLGAAWAMAGVCVLGPWLVAVTVRAARAGSMARTCLAALALGLLTQALFVPLDAERMESLLTRHEGGHAEFHTTARARRGAVLSTLRHYDEQAASGELGAFPPSKPPGALAVYAALDALGRGPLAGHLQPLRTLARERPRVASIEDGFVAASFGFPLFTALLLPLMVALGVRLHGGDSPVERQAGLQAGAAAAVLAATSPAMLLITYHLDGALYPLFAMLTLIPVSSAMRVHGPSGGAALSARVLALGTLGGVVFGVGLYVSYSLLPVLGLVLGVPLAFGLATPHRARPLRRAALVLLGFALGALGVTALLAWTVAFHPVERFVAAMAYHARWKAGVPSGPWRGWALLEWALYAGFPLVGLLLWRAAASLARLRDARRIASTLLPVGAVALLLVMSALSGTNEVARMWLFMVPVAALAAVSAPFDSRRVSALAAGQLLLALVMKANQVW